MKKRMLLFSAIGLLIPFAVGCTKAEPPHQHEYSYSVVEQPNKTIYLTGQDFDPAGITISKSCNGCDERFSINDVQVLDGEDLQAGENEVTIKVEDFTTKISIEVKESYTVACCGDSLTEGHMWPNEAYPNYINDFANHTFNVVNCGRNGISITGYGGSWDNPNDRFQIHNRDNRNLYKQSLDCNPDVVLLFLGTNDATGWANAEPLFEQQYRELIDSYIEKLGAKTKFIMMVSPPTQTPNNFNIPNDKINDYVNPIQRQLGAEYGMEIIDLRELFEAKEEGYASFIRNNDGVHLSKSGAQFVAEQIANVLDQI